MQIKVKKIHSFTENPSQGNPAGVVENTPQNISEQQMKTISKNLCVSETAFLFPSKKADYKIRFFSPETEVDLCGHATIATFFNLGIGNKIPSSRPKTTVTQETKIGILPVDVYFKNNICKRVMMTQTKPIFKDIELDFENIASALGINKKEIDRSLPQQIVSTGLFELPLCIKSFDTLKLINPNFAKIKKICTQLNVGSFHLYTFETIESSSLYHSRNFAPLYGINEDPVTGTANGATCSYLVKNKIIAGSSFICEQGDIIDQAGRVFVEITDELVRVGGKAVIVEEIEMIV